MSPQHMFPRRCSHQLTNKLVATGEELRLFLTSTVPAGTLPSWNKKEGLAQFRPAVRISKGDSEHLTLKFSVNQVLLAYG